MSSNALLWPSQGTKPEERLDKHKWLRLPSQGVGGVAVAPPPVGGAWIDDLGIEFIDENGRTIVFSS